MCNPLKDAEQALTRARAEYREALKPGNLEATLICVAVDKLFNTRKEVCKVRYEITAKEMREEPKP